jgi:thymidylate synthase
MSIHIVAKTLESAWLRALKEITTKGQSVKDTESFLEIRNMEITFENSFETESKRYQEIFGTEFLEYMQRVYSPLGDEKTGRNYHRLIYGNGESDNQVSEVIKKLQVEPLTRSATIVLTAPDVKKKPCVSEINFSIRDNLLHTSIVFKSSDFAKKFIPDIVQVSLVHREVAQALGIARGDTTAFIFSAQIYEEDLLRLKKEITKLRGVSYFKTDVIRKNWDNEAETWDINVENPKHYVNIENGYARFLDFINKVVPESINNTVPLALDSGCGTGIIAEKLNNKGYKVIAVDISTKMIEYAHKDSKIRSYTLANSLDLPYVDNFFDLIVSRGVLISHVGRQYVEMFLKEHSRTLKHDGLFVFDFITKFDKSEIKNKRTKAAISYKQMKNLLQKYNFEVLERSGEDSNRVNAIFCKKI